MDTEAAAAFWSYTHVDNSSDNGRIVRLAEDLRNEYQLLTSGKLTIFLDRKDIKWGDKLRERIDEALTDTTFFIPIITPAYFKSAECRRELLAFSQEVKRLNVEALLLPVYYVAVPEFKKKDRLPDEAMQLVRETKYEDWTKLRLEDLDASAYRKGVHGLAQRIAEIVRDLTSQSSGLLSSSGSVAGASTAEEERIDNEEPGLLDLIADGEEALPKLAAIAGALGPEMERITEAVKKATEAILQNNARRGGATGGLKVMTHLAEEIRDPAKRILELGQQNAATLLKVDPAVSAIIGQIEADPHGALKVEGIPGYVQGIRTIAASGRAATKSLSEFSVSIEEASGTSRVLRPVFRDIQNGLRGFVDAQAIYDEWERRLDALDLPAAVG